jgi:hypothetical protein
MSPPAARGDAVPQIQSLDSTLELPMNAVEPTESPQVVPWGQFASTAPALAGFGAARLADPHWAYLATVRPDGSPRVHPVTPILTPDRLLVFMEPTSPKGHDLRARPWYALHNAVPDMNGTGGEFAVNGAAVLVDSPSVRMAAAQAAPYDPADRYVLFELLLAEVQCKGYGDVSLPEPRRWRCPDPTGRNLAAARTVRWAGLAVRMETR